MIPWKSLTKYRYSKQRNEVKYHTDFALTEGKSIEKDNKELMEAFKEIVPQGKVWQIHFEMAVEESSSDDGIGKLLFQLKEQVKYPIKPRSKKNGVWSKIKSCLK